MAWLERRAADMLVGLSALGGFKIMDDPEAIFQEGWLLCDVGEHEAGLGRLRRAVGMGYFVAPTLADRPQFDALRNDPRFQEAAGGSGKGPPAIPGRVPRRRRRAASRPRVLGAQLPAPRCPARRAEVRRSVRTLARPRDKAEILARLKALRPDDGRRWGRMSAPQMVCHLSDAFRMAMGHMPVSHATGPLQRTIVKWIALYVPLAWPGGRILTRPEIDQELAGTRPRDFAADVASLEALVERITAPAEELRLGAPSDLRPHVGCGMAPLGLPPHGPPPAAIRRLVA